MARIIDKIKRLFPTSGVKLYSENLAWSVFSRGISLIVSMGTISIVARILGPESFGTLNYIVSFGTLVAVFVTLGIDTIIYKDLTQEKDNRGEILGTGIVLKTLAGLVTILVISFMSLVSSETYYIKIAIIVFSISYITQPLSLLFLSFLADRKSKLMAAIQIITVIIVSGLKIFVIYYYQSLILFILVQGMEMLISGLLSLYFLKKESAGPLGFKFSKKRAKGLLVFAVPLTLFGIFSEIYNKIDIIMLRHMQSVTTVGLYSAAVRLTEVWYMVSNVIIVTIFPALSSAFERSDKKEYLRRLVVAGGIFGSISIFIILITIIFGKFFIAILYGKEFVGSLPILFIYILSLPGTFALSILYQDFLLRKKMWSIAFVAIIPAFINVALNLYLIPGHSAAGAAIATAISYNLITAFFCLHLLREYKKNKHT